MARIIGQFGRHTIYTHLEPDIQPGHQAILVTPADFDGMSLLRALTGATPEHVTLVNFPEGQAWKAPHDEVADQRLIQLVDLCADLRFSAPEMLQLRIEGVGDD